MYATDIILIFENKIPNVYNCAYKTNPFHKSLFIMFTLMQLLHMGSFDIIKPWWIQSSLKQNTLSGIAAHTKLKHLLNIQLK